MALINQAIASLFNGVSQQPPQLRLSSQCEVCDNFYPTIAKGLNKRPPTIHKAKLSGVTDTSAYTSIINRDTSERYVLVLRNGALAVHDAFTGAARTVTAPDGLSYLTCTDPLKDFSTVTVADHTFIVNKTVKAAYTSAKTAIKQNVGYVSFTFNGAGYQRTCTVSIPGFGSGAYSGSANDIGPAISAVKSGLTTSLGAGWSVTEPWHGILRIERLSTDTNWRIEASDSYGNSMLKVLHHAVQNFSDLPLQVNDGYLAYITSKPTEQGKGYYVRYNAETHSYIEAPAPDTFTTIDPATMPHKLVRNADGSFTLQRITWGTRKVGDYASNPWPSFIGRTIADVFFYRNRLGFLSDENVCLSTAGDYFNFFAKTVTAVTDTDPIDEAVANTKVSLLRFAVPFNKVLLLFSDQTQFQLHASDVLTPKTVKADPVTEFVSSPICRPVGAGQQLFFVSDKPTSSSVREYYVEQETMSNDAADITAHAPSYIPTGAFKLSVSTSEDVLCLLSTAEKNALYVYKYYWGAEEKVQSAWFRFLFAPSDVLMGAEFIGSTLYLVIKRSDGLHLEELPFEPDIQDAGFAHPILLDRKVLRTGTFNSTTNRTSWTLPWTPDGTVQAVLGESFGAKAGSLRTLTPDGGYTVSAPGNLSGGACWIGVRYEARFRFSEQFIKDQEKQVIANALIKLRRMTVSFEDTGYFRGEVTPTGRETYTYPFTGKRLGVSGVTLGSPSLSSGSFRLPVKTSSRGVRIDLVNDSPFPSSFQSAEWEGEVVIPAKR